MDLQIKTVRKCDKQGVNFKHIAPTIQMQNDKSNIIDFGAYWFSLIFFFSPTFYPQKSENIDVVKNDSKQAK